MEELKKENTMLKEALIKALKKNNELMNKLEQLTGDYTGMCYETV